LPCFVSQEWPDWLQTIDKSDTVVLHRILVTACPPRMNRA
jgi:hypothetical protein